MKAIPTPVQASPNRGGAPPRAAAWWRGLSAQRNRAQAPPNDNPLSQPCTLPPPRFGKDCVRHGEVFAPGGDASGAGLALAFALDGAQPGEDRPWLWVQDKTALRRSGRPYRPGLPAALRHRLIHVAAQTPEDLLFALEEGLRCRDLAFVIGELAGNPKALSFTAQRRLSLAAEKHGTPLWLVRLDAARDLSSARLRWAVKAAASTLPRWDNHAPGHPAWHAELFRARGHPSGEWLIRSDGRRITHGPLDTRLAVPSGEQVRA